MNDVCIHVCIKAYPSDAVTFDASVWFKQLRLCRLYLRFDFFPVSKGIRLVCSVQLVLGTLADGAVVGAAHSGGCNLQAVHAEQVPEATTQAHLLSANRKYLSSEHRVLIWAMTGSIQRWYSSRRRCLCHSTLLLVNAPGFKIGRSPSGLHA